jgi:hypothetical protein
MHPAASRSAFSNGFRILATALLVFLAVAPACSFLCQARTCDVEQTSRHDSACHHQVDAMSRDSFQLSAAPLPCSQHELALGLPASIDSLQSRLNPAGASSTTFAERTIATAFFAVTGSPSNPGYRPPPLRSEVSSSSSGSSLSLRI